MHHVQPLISSKQEMSLHQKGMTRFGKQVLAAVQKQVAELCHPLFDHKRYAVFIEHDTPVVDENGEKAQPVLALIVTAPNIGAARKRAVEKFPGHIRRFLHWKELPLYPIDDEKVA